MPDIPGQKEITVEQVVQKILSHNIFEDDLEFDPEKVKNMFVTNIVTRSLARMYGQSQTGPKAIRVTEDGSVAVVQRGGAFDDYERIDKFFTAANQEQELTFSQQVTRIDIFTYDGKVDYQLTRDEVKPYGAIINLFEDSFYSLDFFTKKIKATSKSYKPRSSGTTDGTTADKLVDSGADFVTDGVAIGDVIANTTDNTECTVTAIDSLTTLSVSQDIFVSGENYVINGTRLSIIGWFREAG